MLWQKGNFAPFLPSASAVRKLVILGTKGQVNKGIVKQVQFFHIHPAGSYQIDEVINVSMVLFLVDTGTAAMLIRDDVYGHFSKAQSK